VHSQLPDFLATARVRLFRIADCQLSLAVLVWKIDRFGRSLKHLVNALAELAALQ
jgi:DNA invertase Pin-like site-specific DNA recombinase